MDYETKLLEATDEPVLAKLKGQKGLFAVTPSALWYVNDEGVKSAPLKAIRKVSGRGGRLVIGSEREVLIEAPLTGFELDEVKVFFQELKGYIKEARMGTLEVPRPPMKEPEPEVPAESPPLTPPEEPAAFPEPLSEERPPVVPEPESEPKPTPETEPQALEPTPEPRPRTPSALGLPLKLLSVLTALYALGLYFLYPEADPILLGGAVLFGLGFALVEWKIADL